MQAYLYKSCTRNGRDVAVFWRRKARCSLRIQSRSERMFVDWLAPLLPEQQRKRTSLIYNYCLFQMPQPGFEPGTTRSSVWRSPRLSYWSVLSYESRLPDLNGGQIGLQPTTLPD